MSFLTRYRTQLLSGLLGIAIGSTAMAGLAATGNAPVGGMDRKAIENIVRDYILNNPEILPQAMERLQQREQGKQVSDNRAALETPFAGAWAGNPNGDVVLVEFSDFACGYCRKSVEDVNRLIADDPKLKVVFREMPILSAESEVAAKAALRAAQQGKYMAFHNAVFAAGPLSPATLANAIKSAGIDANTADPAFTTEIDKNLNLARKLGFSGTPTFVIGDQVISGAAGYDALKAAVASARAGRAGGKSG